MILGHACPRVPVQHTDTSYQGKESVDTWLNRNIVIFVL